MPTRAQVLQLLDAGHSFQTAGRQLGIPPGRAFMIATGLPADRSDNPHPDEPGARLVPAGSSQDLVNPPAFNPTRGPAVVRWVRTRAARELEQGT
jgi:hypothetical protein